MNRIFGLVWSSDKGMVVPVPEVLAKRRRSKRRLPVSGSTAAIRKLALRAASAAAGMVLVGVLLASGAAKAQVSAAYVSGSLGGGTVTLDGTGMSGSLLDIMPSATTVSNNIVLSGGTSLNGIYVDPTASTGTVATLSGVISGAGSVGLDPLYGVGNAATILMTGANTYTGVTYINGYTAVVAGATQSQAFYVGSGGALPSTLIFSPSSSTTIAAAISGTSGNLDTAPASGTTLTLSGSLSGSLNLDAQSGTTVLSASNMYTGTTTVESGAVLILSGTGTLGSGGALTNNGTLNIGGASVPVSLAGLTGSGGVNLGAQSMTFTFANGTFLGAITGTGGVTVGSGVETFSGANTYSGATTIGAGAMLALAGSGSIANSSVVSNGGAFDISQTSGGASVGSLSGSGAVNLGGQTLTLTNASGTFSGVLADGGLGGGTGGGLTIASGTETLSGANTYSGATTIGAGATLSAGASNALSAKSAVQLANASNTSLNLNGNTEYIGGLSGGGASGGNVALGAGGQLNNAGGGSFGGVISGAGSYVQLGANSPVPYGSSGILAGGGTETFTNVNTYTGSTQIGSGATLALSGAGSIAASNLVQVNGAFDISGVSSGTTISALSGSGNVNLGSQMLTVNNANGGPALFSGIIADGGLSGGTGGSLTLAAGQLILSGNNSYTGATTINTGAALQLGNGGINGTVAGNVVDNGSLAFNLSGSTLFRNVISGSGNLTQSGPGTTVLTGANTYTGGTTITAGALQVGNGGTTGWIGGNVADNGTLIFDRSDNITPAGSISGAGGLTQSGSGILTLTGGAAYTGATTITAGTLALSGAGSIAQSSGLTDNGMFDISGATSPVAIASLSGTGNVNLGGQNLTLANGAGNFSGVIADGGLSGGTGGSLTIAGGTQILSGNNTPTPGARRSAQAPPCNSAAAAPAARLPAMSWTTARWRSIAPIAPSSRAWFLAQAA